MPPALETAGTNRPAALETLFSAPAVVSKPLFELGPVQFRPHLLYRFMYGDGIPAAPGQNFKTAIHEIYPGILLNLGSHWSLDYTPTLRFYSNRQFSDTTDHAVSLNGGVTSGSWVLGFGQSYISSSQPLLETGTETGQQSYNTALSAIYHFNDRTSLELGANQNFLYLQQGPALEQLSDSKTWSTLDWFNYQFDPKFSAAVGVGFGYVDMTIGPNMTFEQLQGRVNWRPGEKLTLTLTGGAEDRQFLSGGASDLINPLYGVAGEYRLFQNTSFYVSGHRVVAPAYFQGQVTETSDVSGGFRQRLFEYLFLDLSGGYYFARYVTTVPALPVNREDHGTFFNARLSVPVLKRGTVAVFYQATQNTSNEAGFDVSSSQVGVDVGYRF
jgi:hypothetical protein